MYIFDGKVLDAYGVLGISSGVSDDEVKRAYRKLAAVYHPDRNSDREEWAKKKMQVINEAYEEIIKRRKGTYKPTNVKYQASDDSIQSEDKSKKNTHVGSNFTSVYYDFSKYSNNHTGDKEYYKHKKYAASDSSDYDKYREFDVLKVCINDNYKFYSNLCDKLVKKSRNMLPQTPELKKLNKLIDIFREQKNIYYDFYERFNSTRNINILSELEKEFNEFKRNASCVKNLYKYLDEEMKPIKAVISVDFSSIHRSEYVDIVVRCIFCSVYFECFIKENIERYVKCSSEEQFEYAYEMVAKEFEYYLWKNGYNLKDLGSFLKTFKFKIFIINYCKRLSFYNFDEYKGNKKR